MTTLAKKCITVESNQKVHWHSSSEEHERVYNPIIFQRYEGLWSTEDSELHHQRGQNSFFFFCRVSTHFCPYGVSRVYNFAVSSVKLHLFSVALLPQPASVPAGICCLQNISLPLNLTLPRLLQHRPITFLFTHTNWHTHAHTPKQRERTNTTPTQVQKNT